MSLSPNSNEMESGKPTATHRQPKEIFLNARSYDLASQTNIAVKDQTFRKKLLYIKNNGSQRQVQRI